MLKIATLRHGGRGLRDASRRAWVSKSRPLPCALKLQHVPSIVASASAHLDKSASTRLYSALPPTSTLGRSPPLSYPPINHQAPRTDDEDDDDNAQAPADATAHPINAAEEAEEKGIKAIYAVQTELTSYEAAQAGEILQIVKKFNQQKLPVYARRQKEIEQVC